MNEVTHKPAINWYFFVLTVILMSCNNEPTDNDDPVISNITVDAVADSTVLIAGSSATLQATCTDDNDLLQIRMKLKPDFSGLASATDTASPYEKLELTYVYDISGKQYPFTKDIQVNSLTTAGPYFFELRVADVAGRQSELYTYPVLIENTSQPSINLSFPLLNNTETFTAGDTLNLSGTITDDEDLIQVRSVLRSPIGNTVHSNNISLTDTIYTTYDLSGMNIVIPASASPGIYTTILTASDKDGNTSYLQGKFNVQ